jgi:UPF0755 protein
MKKILAFPVAITLLVILAIGSVLGFRYVVSAPSDDASTLTFKIDKGESVRQVADDLQKSGLVRNGLVYRMFIRFSGLGTKIQAGQFQLPRNLSMKDLTYRLARGTTDQKITILEGWRIEEIAQYLEKSQVLSKEEFLESAGTAKLDYNFLPTYSSLDRPHRRLEGYLFPDTYEIAAQSSPEDIIKKMLNNFSGRLTGQMKEDVSKNGLSLPETITLASIVEREVRTDADRPVVAGILLKRLKTPGWKLESDVTLQFALGYDNQTKTWWRKDLTVQNLQLDSPYNTRKNSGFPPTPISSPGLASIKAAIYPQSSDYWFYLAGSDGAVHYAKTIEEHTANIQKYLH